jgi:hypothetical protein
MTPARQPSRPAPSRPGRPSAASEARAPSRPGPPSEVSRLPGRCIPRWPPPPFPSPLGPAVAGRGPSDPSPSPPPCPPLGFAVAGWGAEFRCDEARRPFDAQAGPPLLRAWTQPLAHQVPQAGPPPRPLSSRRPPFRSTAVWETRRTLALLVPSRTDRLALRVPLMKPATRRGVPGPARQPPARLAGTAERRRRGRLGPSGPEAEAPTRRDGPATCRRRSGGRPGVLRRASS